MYNYNNDDKRSDNMKQKIKDNILLSFIILNIIFVFVFSIIDTYLIFNMNTISLCYIIAFIINIIVLTILFIYKKFIKKDYRFELVDLWLLLLVVFGLISTIYSIHPTYSLYGNPIRKEGLYTLLYYYSLFSITRFIKQDKKKYIIAFILAIGLFEVMYGYLQKMNSGFVDTALNKGRPVVYGTFLNSNFYSTFMLLCLCFSIGICNYTKNNYYKVLFGVITLFFAFGLILSNTLSGIVGLAVVCIYLIGYSIKNKNIIRNIVLIVLISIMCLVLSHFNFTTITKDIGIFNNQVVEISKGNISDNFGTNRIGIWKRTMEVVPKYIIHGGGIDNFAFVFGNRPLVVNNKVIDKAHNEYLQILVTEGIFALICYLLFYITVLIKGRKNKVYYKLPVIGYLVQAFFNISVIAVAPFFFISIGMLYDND